MRRMEWRRGLLPILALLLAVLPIAAQQQGTINPRIPPPPPPEEPVAQPPAEPAPPPPPPAPAPALPATVLIPPGTRIAVVLDTPLSTRISKDGQPVAFRTVEALRVQDTLEIPLDTSFSGTVVKVKRPGSFGQAGELRVKVDRLNLSTGATAAVTARLESGDARAQGQISSDHNRAADLYNLGLWTLNGTLLGAQIKGGKGRGGGRECGCSDWIDHFGVAPRTRRVPRARNAVPGNTRSADRVARSGGLRRATAACPHPRHRPGRGEHGCE